MAVSGGLPVAGRLQLQIPHNAARAQIEYLSDDLDDFPFIDVAGAEGIHHDRDRVGVADHVSNLDFQALGNPGGHQVLGHVAGGVGPGAIPPPCRPIPP